MDDVFIETGVQMATILVASLSPRAGKTTIITGIAQNLRQAGHRVTALRLHSGDPLQEGPQLDARLYSLSPFLNESPGGPLSIEQAAGVLAALPPEAVVFVECDDNLSAHEAAAALNARILYVSSPNADAPVGTGADGMVDVIVNKAAERRLDETDGAQATRLGSIPEDAVLASFTVGQLHDVLEAKVLVEGDFDRVIERVVIGPVSADPGREYFWRFPNNAVITRSHKPDLLLAAMDAGTNCLVIAGGKEPLEYVIDRALSYEVPVLLTMSNTFETARALEGVYSTARFSGRRKAERAAEMTATNVDSVALMRTLGLS
jgi:BioD-like phosphotransacetylase family protein